MLSQIFIVIQFLMKLIGIWEYFVVWTDKQRVAAAEIREQERAKALEDLKKAQTEDDFDKAQDRVVGNKPK